MLTKIAAAVRNVLISAPEVSPPHNLRRESILFKQNQGADALFLVEAGLVKLTRTSESGNKHILAVVGSHQFAGEECLTEVAPNYTFEAECLTDAIVYKVPLATVKRLFGIPDFAIALVSYALARDLHFIQKMENLAFHDVEYRILHGLAELARMVKPNADSSAFPIPMTQAEIASSVGATRETTSTTLSHLRSRSLVSLSRRLVTTVHPDTLIKAANDGLSRSRGAT